MDQKLENPAQRLLQIVDSGREISQNTKCREAWRRLLHAQDEEEPILLRRLGKAMSLIGQASDEISKIEGINPDRYLDWVAPLDKAFSAQNLNGEWKSFIGHINDHVVNYLSNSADILAAHSPRSGCDIENLRDIVSSISDLMDEITQSELPPHVKQYMCGKLRAIQLAIDEYEIAGAGPITEAVESAFGHMVVDSSFREGAKNNPVAKKFWRFVGRLALVVSTASGTLSIASAVQELLPSMPGSNDAAEDSTHTGTEG